ncbi:IncA family protein [Chlamydia caviae]|uniref:Uncharacterized protein n=1 Tax=Chlamydia caviae (strain ATCC VR-813 / DSM 19441 / 03DC25 / GPIC) TaxID=227941 RepID=Q823T7_CHLCV|nr:IncA family protein [Chlamydia caviae]AAP05067.1 hypothetical protein CCA_00318 [Chlamydia caviae GPIC]
MIISESAPSVAVKKNHTTHTITAEPSKEVESKKRNSLIALICLLVLALLAVVMLGGFLVTPFFPGGVYIGIAALSSLLVGMVLFPIIMSCLSKSPANIPVRPKDLDLSKLDTRHNRLLHEIIKKDEKKYAQEQEEKIQKKQRRPLRTRPQQKQAQETSSDESPKPRRRTSPILDLIRPKSPSSNTSSSPSSSDSDTDADAKVGPRLLSTTKMIAKAVTTPPLYQLYKHLNPKD